jgi:ActR/RegA family two-component response regulator
MRTEAMVPVLLFDDGLLDASLRRALSASGFQLLETADVEAGVRLLRESPEPMVAFFTVSLAANMLTGLDQVALLGALLHDEALARRHAFILVTSTPHEIRMALGRVLDRTHVTLLASPLDRERLLSATWLAASRFASDGATPLSSGTN